MPLNKKFIFYYYRISIPEGLNTKLSDAQLEMNNFNKNVYQRCRLCCSGIKIKKAFKENENICKLCLKLLEIQDIRESINPKIDVFWKDNQQYRICKNIYHSFADSIFREENIEEKWGKISQKTLSIYLKSST